MNIKIIVITFMVTVSIQESFADCTYTTGTLTASPPNIITNTDGSATIKFSNSSCSGAVSNNNGLVVYSACSVGGGYYGFDSGKTGIVADTPASTNVYYVKTPNDASHPESASYPGGSKDVSSSAISQNYLCADAGGDIVAGNCDFGHLHYPKSYTKCVPWHPTPGCTATDVTIDFGDFSPAEFDGTSRTVSTSIKCTGDSTVSLSFSSNPVSLSNGANALLSSTATSDNPAAIPENVSTLIPVSATLHGNPDIGSFSGSSPLIVNVQ